MSKKKKTCKKGGVYESARYLVRRKVKTPKKTPKKMKTRRRVSKIRRTSSAPLIKLKTPSRRSINPRPPSELLKYVSNKALKKAKMKKNTRRRLAKARSL